VNPKPTLDGIADAILDGTPIDWRSIDTEDPSAKAFVEPVGGGDARGRLGRAEPCAPSCKT
jgi:hypothetical protein